MRAEIATLREAMKQKPVPTMATEIRELKKEVSALREEAKRYKDALTHISRMQILLDFPDRCIGCDAVADEPELIRHAADCPRILSRKALADPPHPILNEDEFPHGSVDTEPGFSLADPPCNTCGGTKRVETKACNRIACQLAGLHVGNCEAQNSGPCPNCQPAKEPKDA